MTEYSSTSDPASTPTGAVPSTPAPIPRPLTPQALQQLERDYVIEHAAHLAHRSYHGLTELELLVALAQTGDEEAEELLFSVSATRIARRLTARWRYSHEDAHDGVQNTWLRVMRALPGYAPAGAGFNAWLDRITDNLARDSGRRQRNRPMELVPDWPQMLEVAASRVAGPIASPEHTVIEREAERLFTHKAEQAVTPRQWSVLRRRFIEDMSVADVAAELRMTEGAVKAATHKGLSKLRSEFGSRRARPA